MAERDDAAVWFILFAGLRVCFLEPKERLELSTPRLRSGCSTVELLRPEERLYQGRQLVQGFAGLLFRRLHVKIERNRNIAVAKAGLNHPRFHAQVEIRWQRDTRAAEDGLPARTSGDEVIRSLPQRWADTFLFRGFAETLACNPYLHVSQATDEVRSIGRPIFRGLASVRQDLGEGIFVVLR